MDKKLIKSGDPIPPEFFNALQDLSFTKGPGEVGHLPSPPNYARKIQCIESSNGIADLSTVDAPIAMIYHYGSPTSTQKQTLTVHLSSSNNVRVIIVVPVGADYELDVVLPANSQQSTTITLKAGANGVLKMFSYGGSRVWKYCELNRRDLPAYFASIVADTVIKAPVIRVGSDNNYMDIEFDLDEQHAATYLGLLFGGYSGLSSNQVVHFPKIHVWKQSTFEKDVEINANLNVEKTVSIGSQEHAASLNVYGQIFTPAKILAKNVPGECIPIGSVIEGVPMPTAWQLASRWSVGEVKKIFNDSSSDIDQYVFVPLSLSDPNNCIPMQVHFPRYMYREFTCVGFYQTSGSDFAVLIPSA